MCVDNLSTRRRLLNIGYNKCPNSIIHYIFCVWDRRNIVRQYGHLTQNITKRECGKTI